MAAITTKIDYIIKAEPIFLLNEEQIKKEIESSLRTLKEQGLKNTILALANIWDGETTLYFLKEMMSQLEKSGETESSRQLQYVVAAFNALHALPKESHYLDTAQALTLSAIAVETLFKLTTETTPEYIRMVDDFPPRPLLIDREARSYFILSKEYGTLKASGTSKKVTEALEISFQEDEPNMSAGVSAVVSASVTDWMRKVNKKKQIISDEEVELTRLFGNLRLAYSYPNKANSETRTMMLVSPYRKGTLEKLLTTLSIEEAFQAFINILTELQDMHTKGYAHRDLKSRNIHIELKDGRVTTKIDDFGDMVRADTIAKKDRLDCYGTSIFTDPLFLLSQEALQDAPSFAMQIAKWQKADLFAFGCLMFECLEKAQIPWSKAIYVTAHAQADQKLLLTPRAVQVYKKVHAQYVANVDVRPESLKKELSKIAVKLLDPNLESRLTSVDECLVSLYKLIEN